MVTEKPPIVVPAVTKLTPASVAVGKTAVIKAVTSGMTYDSDFSITIDGKKATITYQCSSYFKFRTPTDIGAGTYDVIMNNYGQVIKIGSITFTS